MGSKKKKYNARFPPARIKKIMQMDEEVGKIAAAVPVVISRALELFLETLIKESVDKAGEKNARTLSSSHIKTVIHNNPAFDFLKSQVTAVPDLDGGDTPTGEGHSSLSLTTSRQMSASDQQSPISSPAVNPVQRKRSRPPKDNNGANNTASAGDTEAGPPKKKRGRPPKVKIPEPENSIASFTPDSFNQQVSVTEASKQGEDLPETKYKCMDQIKQAHVQMSPDPSITSIFSTDDTVLSHAGGVNTHKSPAAHSGSKYSGNNTGLVYTMGQSHTTSQQCGAVSGSNTGFRQMYANLSPTSQPIDLSTKSFDMAVASKCKAEVHCNPYKTEPKVPPVSGNGHNSFNATTYRNISSMPSMSNQQQPSLDKGEDNEDDDDYDT